MRPDWVCEILSPSNEARDRVTKHGLYRDHGVPHYWIVDVEARVLEAHQLRDGEFVVRSFGEGAKVRIAPFMEVELEVRRLFPPRA